MEQNKKQEREYVEAVPGPAIVISKQTYEKMQQQDNSKENKERLEKYKPFFDKIQDETKNSDDEFTL